jgi:hypothetical protein
MRGHIAKKGNRYYVVIHEGPDLATGKPRYRWHAAGPSRSEAETPLAEIVQRMHDGDYRAPDKITVSDYLLHRWLPSERARVKPSTANSYERNIRRVRRVRPDPRQRAASRRVVGFEVVGGVHL